MGPPVDACPVCDGKPAGAPVPVPDREYGVEHVATYARCSACGSLYQVPMPGPNELAGFYPHDYHSMTGQGLAGRLRHSLRARRLAALGEVDGPLLDYGCGNGDFLLHVARRHPGREHWGYEIAPTPEIVRIGDGEVTLVRGDIETLLAHVPECGLITLNHVVEHLPDPVATLAALTDRLLPGGVLEGQTPAAGSLEHRVLGSRWSGYHAPRHTVVFSPQGLTVALSRAGLADGTVRGAFNPAGLAVSMASLGQGSGGGRIPRRGPAWIGWLAVAALFAPVDLLSGAPGIVDFTARRSKV